MPKVSVICTCFNARQYLEESIQSIILQTYNNFELILVDDGCTDGSSEIMRSIVNQYPRVTLIKNERNLGVPMSRNRALAAAKGEYIAIHDADDISFDRRLEKESAFLDKNPDVSVVGSLAVKISHGGSQIGFMPYPPTNTQHAIQMIRRFKLNPIIDPSCMYRRSLVTGYGGYSTDPQFRTVQDFYLWCKLLVRGHDIANIQEPLIKYRVNPQGVTSVYYNEMRQATDLIWGMFRRASLAKGKL